MFLCGSKTVKRTRRLNRSKCIILFLWFERSPRNAQHPCELTVTSRSRAPARRRTRVSFTAGPAPHARAPTIPPTSCSLQAGAHGAPQQIIRSGTAHMFLIARRVCVLFAFIILYSFIIIIYIGFFTHTQHIHTSHAITRARTPHTDPFSLPNVFSSFFPSFFH